MGKTTKQPDKAEPSQLWRLAEIMQMRRVGNYSIPGARVYFECLLCLGKSADADSEIQHKDTCPINRMKGQ